MMESLMKYDNDSGEEDLPNAVNMVDRESGDQPVAEKKVDLESEWENFEKMLAAGNDEESTSPVKVQPVSSPLSSDQTATDVPPAADVPPAHDAGTTDASSSSATLSNPYSYLSCYTELSTQEPAADLEKQLEEFLEKTAHAASMEALKQSDDMTAADHSSHSDSNHSDMDSGSETDHSGHSSHSRTPSTDKEPSDKKSPSVTDSTVDKEKDSLQDDRAAAIKRIEEMNPDRSQPPSVTRRSGSHSRHSRSCRSGSRSRKPRPRRSRSRSRRKSRSRSRSRRHRRRSGSRSRRRRHRRRSGSRQRRRSRRSRSRRRSHSHRNSDRRRHGGRRSRRRSNSRERRKAHRKAQFEAAMKQQLMQQSSSGPQRTEDLKSRMKRELQQAAKDAMSGKGHITPQQAMLQTMAAMHAKAQELTGVEVPKFYNPAAINPLKFAEQQQKRKKLWSKAGENKEQSLQKFQGTDVIADEKYRKLMGIKGDVEVSDMSEEQKQKQNELFHKLDQEYALARITTHTHRGMGLGVVSSMAAQSANEQFNRP